MFIDRRCFLPIATIFATLICLVPSVSGEVYLFAQAETGADLEIAKMAGIHDVNAKAVTALPAPSLPAEQLLRSPEVPESTLISIPEPASIALMSCLGGLLFVIYQLRLHFDSRASN